MTSLMNSLAARRALAVVSGIAILALALGVGRIVPTQPMVALGVAGAVLALGLTVADSAIIPLLCLPLLLVGYRVGAAGVGLSVSDAALAIASAAALLFAPRPFSRPLRNLLWLSALYQFATLFTVIANPYWANAAEWVHAWMLVSGALVVGWTIGRRAHAKVGISLLLVTSMMLALITLGHAALQYWARDFGPVYLTWPYGMHKNFVGTVLGFAAVTVYVRPKWMGWGRTLAGVSFWLFAAALMATQSRQAIIGLGVAIFLVALRRDDIRRSYLAVIAVVPALVFVATLVQDQVASGNQFNSVFQRLTWFEDTLAFWAQSPWLGHGLRFWYNSSALNFQPPNGELEVLASAGLVGLAGFLIMVVGILNVLWRVNPAYGTLAVAVLVSRLVQSQLDLFWIAVQTSVPFVLVGICLGVEALHRDEGRLATVAATLPEAVR